MQPDTILVLLKQAGYHRENGWWVNHKKKMSLPHSSLFPNHKQPAITDIDHDLEQQYQGADAIKIEPCQFRPGNWITIIPYGRVVPVQVTRVHEDEIFIRYADHEIHITTGYMKAAPIKLSDGILTSIGFKWQGGDHYETTLNNDSYFRDHLWIDDREGYYRFCRPYTTPFALQNLHHFQNLYFDIYRREYNIDEQQLKTVLCPS